MQEIIDEIKKIGENLKSYYFNINSHEEKEPGHLLAQADLQIHEKLVKYLSRLYPDIPVDSEENSQELKTASSYFVIDPIDGTNNFLCGRPFFSISLAMAEQGSVTWGIVYNPLSQELFHADRTQGKAFYNGHEIQIPAYRPLEKSLFFMGLSYGPEKYQRYLDDWSKLMNKVRKCFFETAPALSICNAALGRIQGFIDSGCSRHGQSAASLVLEMAGGNCENYDQSPYDFQTKGGIFLSAHMKEQVRGLMF